MGLSPWETNVETSGDQATELAQSGALAVVLVDDLITTGATIGVCSLVLSELGVRDIMLVAVAERTREIGVRKALGATRGVILWQFLIEAATLTAIGAIVGLVFGWMVAALIRNATPLQATVQPMAIAAAFMASSLTGILFGLFPASRAARLDPIEALRYE